MFANCVGTRQNLVRYMEEWKWVPSQMREEHGPRGFNVLARAMRARYPGSVFARAAANGESDPLTDLDARLFVGLPPF